MGERELMEKAVLAGGQLIYDLVAMDRGKICEILDAHTDEGQVVIAARINVEKLPGPEFSVRGQISFVTDKRVSKGQVTVSAQRELFDGEEVPPGDDQQPLDYEPGADNTKLDFYWCPACQEEITDPIEAGTVAQCPNCNGELEVKTMETETQTEGGTDDEQKTDPGEPAGDPGPAGGVDQPPE